MESFIRVVFFQRKPFSFHTSIEQVFDAIRQHLPSTIISVTHVFGQYSKGLWQRYKIVREARSNQGDLNHVTGDVHFAAIGLEPSRTILTIHDCRLLTESKGLKYYLFRYFWYTLPLRYCSIITVISEATKAELLRHVVYPTDRIQVIPVPISSGFRYFPSEFNRAKPVILQVGTTVNKNLERVAIALRGLPCRWHIIGQLTQAQYYLLKDNEIEFENFAQLSLADVIEQYKKCDMLVFASTYEGFGLPIAEAQTMGRPVVASNTWSMPEVAGEGACYVDPFDPGSIREGIDKVIQNTNYREALIKNGLTNCKRFEADRIAKQYAQVYYDLVRERQKKSGE